MLHVDLEQAADRLLLEPLARVARIGPGPGGELVGGGGSVIGEGPIPAQALAEVDAGDVEARDGGGEDALDERVGGGGQGRPPWIMSRGPGRARRGSAARSTSVATPTRNATLFGTTIAALPSASP